jgi:hypothetical protein
MAEERHEQTGPRQDAPAAQVRRPAGTAPTLPREEPTRPSTTPSVPERPRSSTSGKKCEVLKDSCEEPADWVAKTPDGVEIFVCEEHKPLIATNYPDTQFEYEEV